jgi:hypothetical protein
MHQECFAAEHAAFRQLVQVRAVAGHDTAPKTDIDPTFPRACALFLLERVARGRDGQ